MTTPLRITQTQYNRSLPSQIPGLALWLDAADSATVITSGANVTQWNDKSSNAHICISNANYGGTTLPTYNSNATYKNVNFVPSQALVTSCNWDYSQSWSCFVALNTVNVGKRWLISPHNGSRPVLMGMATATPQNTNKIYNSAFTTAPEDITGNHIEYTSAENTNASANLLWYRDAVIQASNVRTLGSGSGTMKIGIGANATVGDAMSGTYQLYEVLIYNTFLTTSQRQDVEGYLAWKWNLQFNIPQTHPYYTNPFYPNVTIRPNTSENIFQPTTLSGCVLWLDANDTSRMTLVGSNITQYIDKSSNGIILSNATASNQPTLVLDSNNMPNFQFNGTSQTLSITSIAASNLSLNNEVTIFFIHTPTNSTNSIINWGANPRINFHTPEGSTGFKFDYPEAGFAPTGGRLEANVTNYLSSGRRLEGGYKQGSNQVIRAYGSNLATRINNLTLTGSTSRVLTFGGFDPTGYFYRGTVCELVWYNRGLGDSEIEQVESYLAWKWRVQASLPITHPYYYNRIAPIPIAIATPIRFIQSSNWSPLTYSGLALWLDAADESNVPRTGINVNAWNDKSGNGRNLQTLLSGAGTITYRNTSLVFSNTAYMFINTPVNLQNFTVFFIGKSLVTSGTVNNQLIFCVRPNTGASYDSTDGLGLYYDYGTTSQTRFYGTGIGAAMLNTVTFVDSVLNCYTQNAAGSLSSFLYGSNATTVATTARTTTAQGFAVGAEVRGGGVYTNADRNNFQMNEIIVYNSVLSTAQRQNVEGYLSWKWGLTRFLPGTHQNAYIPP